MSLLLSLDPGRGPTLPAVVTSPVSHAVTFLESYGWFILIGIALFFIARAQYAAWRERVRRRGLEQDPAHVEDVTLRVRQARLAQQAKWSSLPSEARRATSTQSEEDRRLAALYGVPKPQPVQEEKMTVEEAFGSEFYKVAEGMRKKNKKYGKKDDDDSSSSSWSAPKTSGFKPYRKEEPSGGGGRRFGSGPKKGG